MEEMKAIARTGIQEIRIPAGERRGRSTVPYIGETCRIAALVFYLFLIQF